MAGLKFNSPKDVCARYGLSRVTLHRRVTEGQFPEPLRIGPRKTVWSDEQLTAYDAQLQAEAKHRAEARAARAAKAGRAA